jgi:hypothetical protein
MRGSSTYEFLDKMLDSTQSVRYNRPVDLSECAGGLVGFARAVTKVAKWG